MRVGLNLIYLVPGETGGTETYARQLIPQLIRQAPGTRFIAFVNREMQIVDGEIWGGTIEAIRVDVAARSRLQWVWGEQAQLPSLAGRHEIELLHSLANTAPVWGNFRRVATIHDLHHRVVPEAHLGMLGVGMRVLVTAAARRSHRIITPSASTAADVERLLNVDPAALDVIPEGFGAERQTIPIAEMELRSWLGSGEQPIVLSVSAKRPHKNLARLIAAVAAIPVERRPLLVIPGYQTPYEQELQRYAAVLGVEDDIRLLGWLEPERLEGLYAAATCLVCASLHEGFGLPVLEAMARGLPVACSARGALSEVAGDAAVKFDPESVPQITAAIERLLGDPRETERLRQAGRAQAARFTWAATAERTLASYEAAMRGRP